MIRDCWYVAAWSRELVDTPLARQIAGDPIVLFRQSDGQPAALADRCPHRFLPLSMGRMRSGGIECGYHGMTFNGQGQCVRVPGQETIPPSARVHAYPVKEHMGMIWIWPGDPAVAETIPVFDLPQYHEPDWEVVEGEALAVDANYLSLADNLCDPAHVAFVHQSTLGNAAHVDVPITVEMVGNTVTTTRWTLNAEPIPLFQKLGRFAGSIDRWQIYIFHAPNIAVIDFGGADTGTGAPEGDRSDCVWMFACHFLTPIDERRSLDYWLVVKNYRSEPTANDALKAQLKIAFAEDKAILEAIQSEEERVPGAKPLHIAVDKGAVLMRRIVDRMANAS